jgi:hypothetical protein
VAVSSHSLAFDAPSTVATDIILARVPTPLAYLRPSDLRQLHRGNRTSMTSTKQNHISAEPRAG